MTLRPIALASLSALLLLAVSAEAQGKGGTAITACNAKVTTSAILTTNLYCPGTAGIVIGASGITINLGGHVLRGDRTAGTDGIDDSSEYVKLKIENGAVRNFDAGVLAAGDVSNLVVSGNARFGIFVGGRFASIESSVASGNGGDGIYVNNDSASIKSVTASGNGSDGIHVEGSLAKVQSSVASGNASRGVYLDGSSESIKSVTASGNGASGIEVNGDNASIDSSTASGNRGYGIAANGASLSIKSVTASGNAAYGIADGGDSASIQSSTASGNGYDGILVIGNSAVLKANRAEANGFPGGTSDLSGLGIEVTGYTTAPLGRNIALGNDDPAECSPAALC